MPLEIALHFISKLGMYGTAYVMLRTRVSVTWATRKTV